MRTESAHEFDLPLQSSDRGNFDNVGRLCVRGLWQRDVRVFEYRRLRHEGAHEFDLPLQSSDRRNFDNVGRLCVRGLWHWLFCGC